MTDINTITIALPPQVKERGRVRMIRGKPVIYTTKRTAQFEKKVADAWKNANLPLHTCPVALLVDLRVDHFEVSVVPLGPGKHGLRGDIDNYVKSIADGLNKVAYKDDKLVHLVIAGKGTGTSRIRSWTRLFGLGREAGDSDGEASEGQADGGSGQVGGESVSGSDCSGREAA